MDETGVVASLALHVVLEPIFAEVSVVEKIVEVCVCSYCFVTSFMHTFAYTAFFKNLNDGTQRSLNPVKST